MADQGRHLCLKGKLLPDVWDTDVEMADLLQGRNSLHSDGGECNATRPECFSPMTSLGENFDYDGGFCFQM